MFGLLRGIDASSRLLGKLAAWCALAMMFFQVSSVLLRYVFSYGLITFQEAVVYCHATLFLLGAAWVLKLNQHVRVDVFYEMMRADVRRIVDAVALALFVLPVVALIGWASWDYVLRAWSTLEGSRQAGGIPAIFLLKTAILVFAVSVGLQAVALLSRLIAGAPVDGWEHEETPTHSAGDSA